MKYTRQGPGAQRTLGQLTDSNGNVLSEHQFSEEAYERAAKAPGTYTWTPPPIKITVPDLEGPLKAQVADLVVENSNIKKEVTRLQAILTQHGIALDGSTPAPAPVPTPAPSPVPTPAPVPSPAPSPSPSTGKLLRASDLEYIGGFRSPRPIGNDNDGRTLSYGGHALGIGPNKTSLFITGHDHKQYSTEISIPTPVIAPVASMPMASHVQGFFDPFNGRVHQIQPGNNDSKVTGGHMMVNGTLWVTAYTYYDASGKQAASHFQRTPDLSSSNVTGPLTLKGVTPRWAGGAMCEVPEAWKEQLGTHLVGLSGAPIASAGSVGPCAISWDPTDLNKDAKVLIGYPLEHAMSKLYGVEPDANKANPAWNLTSNAKGIIFHERSASIGFVGRHGKGTYCYGVGGANGECPDPTSEDKGGHAYPYAYTIWWYKAEDAAKVRRGELKSWEMKPYAIDELPILQLENKKILIGGAVCIDDRIIISQLYGESSLPVFHVYKVNI